MTKIYLLRHGKVDGPAALYGHTDVNVSADVNNKIIDNYQKSNVEVGSVYTSPLKRCSVLAKILSKQLECNVTELAEFKEMNFGDYDGIAFDDLHLNKEIWQQLELFWQNPVQHPLPNAELLVGFSYRVKAGWHKLIKNMQKSNDNQNALVVCHGGVIRMLLSSLLDIDYRNPQWYTKLKIGNASLTSIELLDGQWSVQNIAKPLNDVLGEGDNSEFCRYMLPKQFDQQVNYGC